MQDSCCTLFWLRQTHALAVKSVLGPTSLSGRKLPDFVEVSWSNEKKSFVCVRRPPPVARSTARRHSSIWPPICRPPAVSQLPPRPDAYFCLPSISNHQYVWKFSPFCRGNKFRCPVLVNFPYFWVMMMMSNLTPMPKCIYFLHEHAHGPHQMHIVNAMQASNQLNSVYIVGSTYAAFRSDTNFPCFCYRYIQNRYFIINQSERRINERLGLGDWPVGKRRRGWAKKPRTEATGCMHPGNINKSTRASYCRW